MMESIGKKASESGEVTEDIIIEVAKEITPKPFVPIVLTSIEHLIGEFHHIVYTLCFTTLFTHCIIFK